MIAKYDSSLGVDIREIAESFQRARTAIHQIASYPEFVSAGREIDFFQESAQGLVATLDVSNYIGAHGECRARQARAVSWWIFAVLC